MGFRRLPDGAFPRLPADLPEVRPGPLAGGRPAHPAIEETELPAIDVYETPTELVVEAELPGVDPAAIGVSAGEGLIVIEGQKQDLPGAGRLNYVCMERSFGAFRRVVLAGSAVDVARATAVCRDGLLRVRVPKIEERRGRVRAIPVTTGGHGERSEP